MKPGKLQYTSIVKEFSDVGVDFKEIIQDDRLLQNEINDAKLNWESAEEKLRAAEICYKNMPNEESKKMYESIMRETLLARYKLAILRIAELALKKTHDYNSAKKKRENILRLINYRLSCLEGLGVKLSIDPFGRIRLDSQLAVINSFESNGDSITEIRKRIQMLSSQIDEMKKRNNEFLDLINDDYIIIRKEKTSVIGESSQLDLGDSFGDLYHENTLPHDNQIVIVKNIGNDFKLNVSKEKARAVVRRVYDMFNKPKTELASEVTPMLVIEEETKDTDYNKIQQANRINENVTPKNISLEIPSIMVDANQRKADALPNQKNRSSVLTADSLFEEISEPFVSAPLFEDRSDDAVFSDKPKISNDNSVVISPSALNAIRGSQTFGQDKTAAVVSGTTDTQSLEDTMPDIFWMTQEDQSNSEDDEKVLSLDEQVDALFKTRKKVA